MAPALRSRTALIAALLAAACGSRGEAEAEPRPVDTTTLADDRLADAVLAECHSPLRDDMTRVAATVTFANGEVVQLFAHLPDQLRVQSAGVRLTKNGERVVRFDDPDQPVDAATRTRVAQLATLLDAAAFGPLHRAQRCERTGPAGFAVTTSEGTRVAVELRPHTLLPARLQFPDAVVAVHGYLRTPTTWIARDLEHGALGHCRIVFDSNAIVWDRDFFAPGQPPKHDARPEAMRLVPGGTPEGNSPTPILVTTPALRWAVVRDPGDWAGRVAAYRPLHEELTRQDQQIAGFPVFWQEQDARWLAAPFRQRDGGPAFVAPEHWTIRELPTARWLVVYPPTGDLAQRVADGEQRLRAACTAQQLQPVGPITHQPFVHLQEGEPPAARLAAPTVRMAVRIE